VKRRVLAFYRSNLRCRRSTCTCIEEALHLPDTKLVREVKHRANRRTGGKQHSSKCFLLRKRKRAVAVRASVSILERNVLLRQVHAKSEASERSKISGPRRSSSTKIRVVDEQLVVLGQKRCLAIRRVLGVPENLCLLRGDVDGDGVGGLVGGAGGEDVDGRGGYGEGGVVPGESYPVADFVELCAGEGVGGDHCETAGGEAGVEAGGL